MDEDLEGVFNAVALLFTITCLLISLAYCAGRCIHRKEKRDIRASHETQKQNDAARLGYLAAPDKTFSEPPDFYLATMNLHPVQEPLADAPPTTISSASSSTVVVAISSSS